MYYEFSVTHFDSIDNKLLKSEGVVYAKNLEKAIKKLDDYFEFKDYSIINFSVNEATDEPIFIIKEEEA